MDTKCEDGLYESIYMQNIQESSVQRTQDSPKELDSVKVTRSIRNLQVVCVVLVVIVTAMAATLGALMYDQEKRIGATESRTDHEISASGFQNYSAEAQDLKMRVIQLESDRRNDLATFQSYDRRTTELEKKSINYSDTIQGQSIRISAVEADSTQLEKSITQLDSKNQEQLGTIQMHSASITSLEDNISQLDTSIKQLDSKNTNQLSTIQAHSDSISDLEDDISQLDTSIKQLDSKNTNQLSTIQAHSDSISDLEDDISQLAMSIKQLESKNTNQLSTIQAHSDSISDLEDDISQLDTSIKQLESKNTNQLSTIQAHSDSISDLEDSHTQLADKMERRKVAFSAKLGSTTDALPVGSKVVFDSVVYQEGDGYNPEDGVFTCPETGVYMFSFVISNGNLQNATAPSINVQLSVNFVTKAYVVSEEFHSAQDDQSSNLVILKVNQGQRVWVETYSKSDVIIWQSFSTFSGALLYN